MIKKGLFFFSVIFLMPILVCAQKPDTITVEKDTVQNLVVQAPVNQYNAAIEAILNQNSFLNSKGTPVSMVIKIKKSQSTDVVFYLLAGLVLLMGVIKVFFARYFTNLFRVFFNTSLRQSQLTDQLLQAKLPSLFFNIFFILSAGIYIFFLLVQYKLISSHYQWSILGACILILAIVYLVKFSTLKFTGWVTGYRESTDTYIFIIFLICKIIGVVLIPFTVLMAFAQPEIAIASAFVSLLIIGLLLFLRFFRSYSLLQSQLKISRFHFFLYLTGVEIIPLLLVYKWAVLFLSKNM
ncbi:DUF4271 domain-containing protein [Ferruginibacter sp.]